MNYWLSRSFDYLIIIPFITGLVRYKKIDPAFRPFFFFIGYSVFNETLFEILVRTIHTNSINSNIYWLVIFFILVFQLKKWKLFELNSQSEKWLYIGVVLIWAAENLFYSSLWNFNSVSVVVILFLLIILISRAIGGLANCIMETSRRNVIYLICGSLIFEFTIKCISEIFWNYGLSHSVLFRNSIMNLGSLSVIIVYTLQTIAIIWIPKKREYTWLSR